MKRRDFIKSMLGIAVGAAVPLKVSALVDALEPIVEPSAASTNLYWLSFFYKAHSGIKNVDAGFVTEHARGWHRVTIPIRADSDARAIDKVRETLNELEWEIGCVQLEHSQTPTIPYTPNTYIFQNGASIEDPQ